MRAMRCAGLVVGLGVILAGGPSALPAEEIERTFNESFAVSEGMKLVLKHGDGDVEIEPWSQDRLDVEVRYRAKASNVGWMKSSDFDVDFRQEGDTVYISGHEPKRVSVGLSFYREYEHIYEIRAPAYLELYLEGEDGDVDIGDWRGSIRLELEDGDVELSNIVAPLTEIVLEDGDVEIDRIQGEIVIDCEDGDVEIVDCQSARARIRAKDGDIVVDRCAGNFEVTLADGTVRLSLLPSDDLDVDVRVGDGDVTMDLDAAVSARFELETRDGHLRLQAADVEDLVESRRRMSGRIGGGDGTIHVRTADGSVTLRR